MNLRQSGKKIKTRALTNETVWLEKSTAHTVIETGFKDSSTLTWPFRNCEIRHPNVRSYTIHQNCFKL